MKRFRGGFNRASSNRSFINFSAASAATPICPAVFAIKRGSSRTYVNNIPEARRPRVMSGLHWKADPAVCGHPPCHKGTGNASERHERGNFFPTGRLRRVRPCRFFVSDLIVSAAEQQGQQVPQEVGQRGDECGHIGPSGGIKHAIDSVFLVRCCKDARVAQGGFRTS